MSGDTASRHAHSHIFRHSWQPRGLRRPVGSHARKTGHDRIAILGDIVGYGADPQYLVDRTARLAEAGAIVIRGNHDEAAANADAAGMNEYASAAIEWTSRTLDAASVAFLRELPLAVRDATAPAALFVHAEASEPVQWNYVHDAAAAERSLAAVSERVTFCGHVHVPQLYNMGGKMQARLFTPQPGAPIPLVGNRKWLAVMGATGQPRDRNPSAAYAIFDTESYELTYFRVPYDIETAAGKIHAAGLPQMLAARLFIGR